MYYIEERSVADDLVGLTAGVVSIYVANNKVAQGDVASVLVNVHDALQAAARASVAFNSLVKSPAVNAGASIRPRYVICLECGRKQRSLSVHLRAAHGLTPDKYRRDYGLATDYPMVAPEIRELRRAIAKQMGLGQNRRTAADIRRKRS